MTALLVALLAQRSIGLDRLVGEMVDLRALSLPPAVGFKQEQSSSYDRASISPDKADTWFANGDAGKFLRVDDKEGRKEYVMADLKGPGVVTRIWSANPEGRVRFYFDGADRPAISERLSDLLSGKAEQFKAPFAYTSARGWNLYFPIPYQKGLRITVDESNGENVKGLYYHVGYRAYPEGTAIESWSRAAHESANKAIQKVAQTLENPDLIVPKRAISVKRTFSLATKSETEFFSQDEPGAVVEVRVEYLGFQGQTQGKTDDDALAYDDPLRLHNVLRNTILEGTFDGETSVLCPISDFFAIGGGPTPYRSLPMEVSSEGDLICRFVMPFAKAAKLNLRYEGIGTPLYTTTVRFEAGKAAGQGMHFRCQWNPETSRTRPMKDMSFLSVPGAGRFVGIAMHVANPTPAWWGEGDEKIYVDGEKLPSTFGTGTEDYFGYAWCDPTPFARPYHGQPRADGPANRGHVSVFRWQILDSIPYVNGIRFDLEMWHWADVVTSFDKTTYWYANPGTPGPRPIDPATLKLVEIAAMKPAPGAIEAEDTQFSATGGDLEKQGGFYELSKGVQLWWRSGKVGDKLTIRVPVAVDGTYEVIGNFGHAKDYGIHEISIDGKPVGQTDFFSPDLFWKKQSLGIFSLKKGEMIMEVTCRGRRPEAVSGNMFGLDYLLFEKR